MDGIGDTLDARVTKLETPLANTLNHLRTIPNKELADSAVVGELVAHLIVRNNHIRKAVAFTSETMIADMARGFTDPVKAREMLGLGAGPDAPLAKAMRDIARSQGFPGAHASFDGAEAELTRALHQQAEDNFEKAHAEVLAQMPGELAGLMAGLSQTIAEAQRKALDARLAPSLKVERLAALRWYVFDTRAPLVLPDCLGVSVDTHGAAWPLPLADLDVEANIFMPLATHRLLIGSQNEISPPPDNLNGLMVGCSWDFFIGRDRSPEFEALLPLLRNRVRQILNAVLEDVIRGG